MDCCITIRKIIFATDFSSGAQAAFIQALDAARTHNAELLLVHVLPPLTQPVPLLNELALGDVSPKIKEDIKNAALIELQKLYAEKCADLPGVGTALLEGDPARALADFAVSQNADLLVVGSTGLSGLAKAMFGSVAAKVVQKAPCSVLVVRRKK